MVSYALMSRQSRHASHSALALPVAVTHLKLQIRPPSQGLQLPMRQHLPQVTAVPRHRSLQGIGRWLSTKYKKAL